MLISKFSSFQARSLLFRVGCAEDMWSVAQRICGGWLDSSENNAKSVQIQWNLPVGTELGNKYDI